LQQKHYGRAPAQRDLGIEILMSVIRRDDAGLRMIQATLGDVRADAELGEAGAYRSPKVMQRAGRFLPGACC
jgi:hypothetical protein